MPKLYITFTSEQVREVECRMSSTYPHHDQGAEPMLILHHEHDKPSEYIPLHTVKCISVLPDPGVRR